MNPVVDIQSLEKKYKHFKLGPLDLKIMEGTVVAIIGPNGSGKSTLFQTIMRLRQPLNGNVTLFGMDVNEHEVQVKDHIGYAGSRLYEAFNQLTVDELAELVGRWYTNWDQAYYERLINRYDINRDEKIAHCSDGTRKKIELILAIAHHPKLLLLDEPTVNVDIISQQRMREDLLKFMEQDDHTIIIATHMQEEVKQLCDYICLLDNGEIKGMFEKDEVQHRWARIWVSHLPSDIKNDARVLLVEEEPPQMVTNQLPELEKELDRKEIAITHVKRLELHEIMEYILQTRNVRH